MPRHSSASGKKQFGAVAVGSTAVNHLRNIYVTNFQCEPVVSVARPADVNFLLCKQELQQWQGGGARTLPVL